MTPVEILAKDALEAGTTVFEWVYAQATSDTDHTSPPPRKSADRTIADRRATRPRAVVDQPDSEDEDLQRQRDWGIG
jgi:hypothetical protein